jgi:hypothetical protein
VNGLAADTHGNFSVFNGLFWQTTDSKIIKKDKKYSNVAPAIYLA